MAAYLYIQHGFGVGGALIKKHISPSATLLRPERLSWLFGCKHSELTGVSHIEWIL